MVNLSLPWLTFSSVTSTNGETFVSLPGARRHLTLLTEECRMKIKQLIKELANHKKNPEEHCTPETFNFYMTRINSMALSLESVLARRHANKFPNSHVNNSNVNATDNLNTFSNNFTRTQMPTHRRNRRKRKPRNISPTIRLDTTSVINLSETQLSHDESSVLARGLTFCPTPRRINWTELSADVNDTTDATY